MINKIAAFLSPYLSEEMAIKGLKKITPKMGKYFAGATAAGYSTKQALDFLRQNSAGKEQYLGNLQKSAQSGNARPDELMAMQRIQQQDNPIVSPKSIPKIAGAAALGGLGAAGISAISEKFSASPSQQQPEQTKKNVNIIQQYSPELFQEMSQLILKGNSPAMVAANMYKKYKDIIAKIQKDNKVDWLELVDSIFGQSQQNQDQQMHQPQQGQGGVSDEDLMAAFQNLLKM